MRYIKLTKLEEAPNPLHPNNIPSNTTRHGTMDNIPKVGKSFIMSWVFRHNDKRVIAGSYFITSEVMNIEDKCNYGPCGHNCFMIFRTLNSIYKIELLDETVTLKDLIS